MNLDNLNLDNVVSTFDYEQLKIKVCSIRNYLNECINALSEIDGKLAQYCSIDQSAAKNLKVNNIIENLTSRVSYLNYTIIPAINSKINN